MMNEKNSIFCLIDEARDSYLDSCNKMKSIEGEMSYRISEATQKIKSDYQKEICEIEEDIEIQNKQLKDYYKLLVNYSTFDSYVIGRLIAILVSKVEEGEYFFQSSKHITYEWSDSYFGRDREKIYNNILLVVHKDYYKCDYNDSNSFDNCIKSLVHQNKVIVLDEREYYCSKKLTFYSIVNNQIQHNIDFNQFPYVMDFIDYLIQYRFEHQKEKINEHEISYLLDCYINDMKLIKIKRK